MQPKIELLSQDLIQRILDEAFELMMKPGIKVSNEETRNMLADAGAKVNGDIVQIPEKIARKALETVPKEFFLHNRFGEPVVRYGGDAVHFDPGSSCVSIMDPDTLEHKPAETPDLIKVIKVAESLPQYDAQSTSMVCNEIPKEIGDLYRLYLVLTFSAKPIVTGAFSTETTELMIDMLSIFAGGRDALAKKPMAVFDVCPSPPLIWSEFGCQNLV